MNGMINSGTIKIFLMNLTQYLIIFFFFEGIIEAADNFPEDTINTHTESSVKSLHYKVIDQKVSSNFYKTDSIFSFHSKKGYFPSLIHNIGEQAVAPFHFTTKQWIYTGVAAGITTALIFADEDID